MVGKAIWRIVCTSEKVLASPCLPLVRSLRFTTEVEPVHFSDAIVYFFFNFKRQR